MCVWVGGGRREEGGGRREEGGGRSGAYQWEEAFPQSSSCFLPHLTSPHLTSPHLTSPHLTSPPLFSPLPPPPPFLSLPFPSLPFPSLPFPGGLQSWPNVVNAVGHSCRMPCPGHHPFANRKQLIFDQPIFHKLQSVPV